MEYGGEGVTVRVGTLEDGFYVEDDGDGIPEEIRDDIFEFGTSTNTDGTGCLSSRPTTGRSPRPKATTAAHGSRLPASRSSERRRSTECEAFASVTAKRNS